MKILFIILWTCSIAEGADSFWRSAPTNELFVIVRGRANGSETGYVRASDELVYQIFSTRSDAIRLDVPKRDQGLCSFTLIKTSEAKGKREYRRSLSNHTPPSDRYDTKAVDPTLAAPEKDGVGPGASPGMFLPKVLDLFALKEPGEYKLTLQFWVWKRLQKKNVLVPLPPVIIPIHFDGEEK